MELYHGSPNLFKEFDSDLIRTSSGTDEGVGFYFTDNKEIAKGYAQDGYLYIVNFKGSKGLSDSARTITKKNFGEFIEEVAKHTDFLTNYGEVEYDGYQYVLNKAIDTEYSGCETDSELLGAIYNGTGEDAKILEIACRVLNCDHIVSNPKWGGEQTVYVALTNKIIEIDRVVSMC